jgi:hypothetical protein
MNECPTCGQENDPCYRPDCPNVPCGEFVGGPLDGLRFTPEADSHLYRGLPPMDEADDVVDV